MHFDSDGSIWTNFMAIHNKEKVLPIAKERVSEIRENRVQRFRFAEYEDDWRD